MRVIETAKRLQDHQHVLRQTTLLAAKWAIECQEFEAKTLLGRHIWQDALAVARIDERLSELGHASRDSGHAAELLGTAASATATAQRLAALYVLAKGRLLEDLRAHAGDTNDVWDEPTVRLLRELESTVEEQHRAFARVWDELCAAFPGVFPASVERAVAAAASAAHGSPSPPDFAVPSAPGLDPRLRLGCVPPSELGLNRPLTVMHVTLTDTEIATIELCSRLILETPDAPWAFVLDMSRQTWDESRHALAFRRRLEELGGHFGDHPLSRYLWDMVGDQPPTVRLAIQQRIGEWTGVEGAIWHARKFAELGDEMTAELWEYVAEDEVAHVAFGNRWIARFAGSESEVERVHDRALKVRQAYGKNLDQRRPFPFNREACVRAGFSPKTVGEYEAQASKYGSRFS